VRRAGEMVRVSAQLIDAEDGSTEWSERYDRPYKDLFALQDEITRAVSGALRARLLPSEHAAAQSDRPPGGSLDAYNAWLEGNFYHSRLSEAGFRRAIEYYAQATQIDAHYARAWSSLSMAWVNLGNFDGTEAAVAHARARESADRALAISPELAAAHRALGSVLLFADFDWRGAEAEFRHALALMPTDGSTKGALAVLLVTVGDLEPAVELMQQAVVTDPLTADYQQNLARTLLALNRLDEAERAIRRAIELQPAGEGNYQVLASIEIQRGHAQAALAAAQEEPAGPARDFALAYARQVNDDTGAADAALKTLIEKYAKVYPYEIASLYALRNNANATFEWLDRAEGIRDPSITNLLSDPFIRRFEDDPRFAAYCRKVRLPVPRKTSAGKST
jgi:tetratricopeptide (TPR) repeat protein